jgi:LuxR family maltose regulon positive regulatory protein
VPESVFRRHRADENTDRWVVVRLKRSIYKTEKKVAKALNVLVKALQLAEPEMFIRIFVDDGADLMDLLQKLEVELASEGGETFLFSKKYISEILSAIFSEQKPTALPDKADLLSERENQILHLMSAGLKAPEIAEELYLSKNTIKWYVRKIYDKMDVHSKAEAIERGHQLGLLK